MTTLRHGGDEHSPALVLRAALALDFMTFAEFSFSVVRPNTEFKPNWHLEALAHKLSQVASGEIKRLIVTSETFNCSAQICASVVACP